MNLLWSVSIVAALHLTSSGKPTLLMRKTTRRNKHTEYGANPCNTVHDGDDCALQIFVPQKTSLEAPVGEHLQIACTIRSTCCKEFEKVSWHKAENNTFVPVTSDSHMNTILEHISSSEKMLRLHFTRIQISHAGLYRCQSGFSMGHLISVSVHDNPPMTNSSFRNETSPAGEAQWMLVASAVGTVAFVVIVICVSVLSVRKGHTKGRTQLEDQDISMEMENQHTGVNPLARPTASDPPTPKETPPSRLLRGGSYVSSWLSRGNEDPNRRTEDEDNSVVYAALDHRLPPGRAARPRRPKEESSEYAAILV
ncbi:B- and T-lymphocyte attenuator-like isoform X2 [Dunckerocampus dactyliophorus]|uniref:B- and T-lymphocyte attenuator-like isoform X2 n=1 Tax=Dunckerocampus dactyliophorus TaxID=161453 RepID=UPI00240721AF|nr:B- and T-lymphocyte attenuator-like isoform X2 [Dunckerocampus dactyliophorus]